MKTFTFTWLLACLPFAVFSQFELKDKFGRNLSGENIVLVDWEGYMANPAIELTLTPPPSATFPLNVSLSGNHARLYFNMPSTASASGPAKTLTFSNANPLIFYLSIFPDRAGGNESHALALSSSFGVQSFPVQVLDHDPGTPVIDYDIILDYSKDITYNFFGAPANAAKAQEAADDWAYFLQDMNFDQVPALNEWTYIWTDNYASGAFTQNASAYTGFLMYCYGLHVNPHISGGTPSTNAFQAIGGVPTNLRRSGTYNADSHGNFNALGWNASITDDSWFVATNLGGVPNDLYSIALHEMGHALTFNPGYPVFQTYKTQGFVNDPAVVAYHGGTVPVNASDHLANAGLLVDRVSKKGLFGSEYANEVPLGRWLITKLNLLIMDAIGYNMKQTSAFLPVSIPTLALPSGLLFGSYNAPVQALGGVPFYKFEVLSGSLPPGLSLNSFSGTLSGLPAATGSFNFTVKVTDYDNGTAQRLFSLNIADNCPETLTVSGALSAPLFQAETTLGTQNATTVGNSASVMFKAGTVVNLNPEFEVVQGGVFEVVMEMCTGQ